MGLDVGVLGAEERERAVDGQLLDLVDEAAAAVVAGAGIALGVFVGQGAAHGLQHGGADEVLRGDQLDIIALALQLVHDGRVDGGILVFDMFKAHGGHLLVYSFNLFHSIRRKEKVKDSF